MIRKLPLCIAVLAVTGLAPALLQLQAQSSVARLPQAWTPPPPARFQTGVVTAVRAGRLFDPRSGALRANQIILMRDDRIVEVGPNVQIPAGARTIDLSRTTVLPGLIDTHLHTMTGSPLTGPGGPGIGPKGGGPAGFAQPLPYHTLVALTNAQRDLNAGFTTVVDLMSHGGWFGTVDLKNAINYGVVQGPHAGRRARHDQRDDCACKDPAPR
jgi:imidazolonepropionase-like amidohydrolase